MHKCLDSQPGLFCLMSDAEQQVGGLLIQQRVPQGEVERKACCSDIPGTGSDIIPPFLKHSKPQARKRKRPDCLSISCFDYFSLSVCLSVGEICGKELAYTYTLKWHNALQTRSYLKTYVFYVTV